MQVNYSKRENDNSAYDKKFKNLRQPFFFFLKWIR